MEYKTPRPLHRLFVVTFSSSATSVSGSGIGFNQIAKKEGIVNNKRCLVQKKTHSFRREDPGGACPRRVSLWSLSTSQQTSQRAKVETCDRMGRDEVNWSAFTFVLMLLWIELSSNYWEKFQQTETSAFSLTG
jgi:hypothetical protein